MRSSFLAIVAFAVACPDVALADSVEVQAGGGELTPYLQCVPYARERSGVQIFGDARTWWDQAEGRYRRGHRPKPGAVMTFRPFGGMTLGHVAAVSQVIDSRTVLLDHANWSPIDGRRGQIERGARAVDVSAANDWSEVRVWYAPLGDLGTTAWPVEGFIYNEPAEGGIPLGGDRVLVRADYSPAPSKAFSDAFSSFDEPRTKKVRTPSRNTVAVNAPTRTRDPIDMAIARYGS